jgi:hypothetical protein
MNELVMMLSRRGFMVAAPVTLASGLTVATSAAQPTSTPEVTEGGGGLLWRGFPRQDAKVVAEVVGRSHSNLGRVKELITTYPELVNAQWDWGFGDWESPLGAASHVGQREIAEYLLENGARMDLFAAAMLGMTDVVKACIGAQPGIQRTLGPHGITLLAHAKAGGTKAEDTLAYLTNLGDADKGLDVVALEESRKQAIVGKYASDEHEYAIECQMNKAGQLSLSIQHVKEEAGSRCVIHYRGEDIFFPAAVPSVKIAFVVEGGKARAVSIAVGKQVVTAQRVEG